jgi:tetratricopeptide (TPR) repeat protein
VAYTSEIEKLEARYRENPKGRNFAPLADAYRKAGLIDNAIELCQVGLQLHPDYVSGHIVHGRCLVDKKDDAGAESVFRRVLDLDPENILALKVLAEISERNERFDQAMEWLNRLLMADPMNGEAADGLSRVRGKAASTPTQPTPAVQKPVEVVAVAPAPEAPAADAPLQVEHEELEIGAVVSADPAARPGRLSIEYMEGPFGDGLADAPTKAIVKPDFELERTSEPPVTASSAATGEVQSYDGSVDFNAVAAEATGLEGLEVDEPVAPVNPDAGVSVEGLARTQYEGSGLFRVDTELPPETAANADTVDLPLIMPEDLEPVPAAPVAGTMRQPSAPVRPEPPPPMPVVDDNGAADTEALSQAEPLMTETMAELYLQQGHREDALRVYEALAAQRPRDGRLQHKVAELVTPKPRHSSSGQSAAAFLKGILSARPGAPAPPPLTVAPPQAPPPPAPPPPEAVAPLAQGGHPDALAPGTATRPASDTISLDSVFGDEGGRGSVPALSEPVREQPTKLPAASGGFSFDDFFGTSANPGQGEGADKGQPNNARPPRHSGRPRSPEQEEDLDQFQAWLKSLKA